VAARGAVPACIARRAGPDSGRLPRLAPANAPAAAGEHVDTRRPGF